MKTKRITRKAKVDIMLTTVFVNVLCWRQCLYMYYVDDSVCTCIMFTICWHFVLSTGKFFFNLVYLFGWWSLVSL